MSIAEKNKKAKSDLCNYSVVSRCHSERSEESLKVNYGVEVSVKGSLCHRAPALKLWRRRLKLRRHAVATVRTSTQDDSRWKELNSYEKKTWVIYQNSV